MKISDGLWLTALAAIWGSSFIFLRILSPVLGTLPTAAVRVWVGGLAFLIFFKLSGKMPEWKKNYRHFLVVGVTGYALPFSFFSFAAQHIPASYSAILNSTVPFWGALLGWFVIGERLTFRKILGMFVGAFGVVLVSRAGVIGWNRDVTFSILAGLLAALSYAASALYVKMRASKISPTELAGGSICASAVVLFPVLIFTPSHFIHHQGVIDFRFVASVLCLGVVCSGLAFLMFFRLVQRIGSTSALLVTFLIPVFGMSWGAIFLSEVITLRMVLGGLCILGGMGLLLIRPRVRGYST